MASNLSAIADEDGDYSDWVELYNYGDSTVNLEGWGLSDNYKTPFKWIFPAVDITPKEYLLVWASGKNKRLAPTYQKKLITEKSEWKYLDDGSNQGTLWREPGFDDNNWQSGIAMLGYDTNQNTQFGTELSYGNNAGSKHITYYFRKSFNIDNVKNYNELELKLSIDDGAIVYLNGHELVRRNMPEGNISNTTFANVVVTTLDISTHQVNASYLVNGNNVIAVEVHQFNRTSSDLRFDLEFESRGNYLHTNFAISSAGEELILTHPTSGKLDSIPPRMMTADVSMGRWPNGTGEFFYFTTSTPGLPNNEERFSELLEAPAFSRSGGFYSSDFQLTIVKKDPNTKIIYTLDGSEPNPGNIGGTTFEYKNSFPGTMLTEQYRSIDYSGPIQIENRTIQSEYIATFATDYHGARYTSSGNRLFKGTTIRAIAVKDGAIPSTETAHTYFVTPELQNRYPLPVLSIITQANHLFDYQDGIYTPGKIWEEQGNGTKNGGAPANYWQRGREWERLAHLEFFDGLATTPVISQNIGIRNHGGWSRAHPMKSLRLYARGSYGNDYFNHRVFPGLPYNQYKRILLRNSGNDWGRSMLRDAAVQTIVSGLRCNFQAYRPIILFINGEYWGLHNIRERYDQHYLNRVYGVDPENIDLLEIIPNTPPMAKVGDNIHYDTMINYLTDNNMSDDLHYWQAQSLIDTENFIDYQISHIYAGNTDWPGNNNDFWRFRTNTFEPYAPFGHDGRWRWLVFDTDFGFNGSNNASHNTLNHATSPTNIWQNPPYSTLILRRLLLNETFKNDFINRFADLLNSHLLPSRVEDIFLQLRNNIEPAMQEHISRWGRPGNVSGWRNEINSMITFAKNRPNNSRQHIISHFVLSGLLTINLDVSDFSHGHIQINSIDIDQSTPGIAALPYPWSGVYFQEIPLKLEAKPKTGYVFSHWEGINDKLSYRTTQAFKQNSVSIKAHFRQANMLYSWDFNSLNADTLISVQTSYSYNNVGVIRYSGNSEGYMDRVNDGTLLNAVDGIVAGSGLRVRNPSESRELIIEAPTIGYCNITFSYATMRTASGASIQEIYYRAASTGEWIKIDELIRVEEKWIVHQFSFPNNEADDNPDFAIKIHFKGMEASEESGNNRFDNMRIEGLDITTTGLEEEPILANDQNGSTLKLWYSNGNLHIENPFQGNAELSIYKSNGSKMKSFNIYGAGRHSVPFTAMNGVYIGRMGSNDGIAVEKFVVTK